MTFGEKYKGKFEFRSQSAKARAGDKSFLPLHSAFLLLPLDALALAANQHTGHVVRAGPPFRESSVRSVPARVVSVVSGGTAFAVVALPAGGTVQNDFVRSGQPIFINVKIDRL